MINNESLVYEMNLNSENNLKFEKIKSFKDENMEKLFHDLIMAVNKVFREYKAYYTIKYDSINMEDFYLEIYKKHNYVDSLDSYFNIRDEDRLAINYFIYQNIEGNDLMDLLFDICRLSKSEISGDVVLCLRLVEGDLLYENLLGIYIQIDIGDIDNFWVFEDKLYERHARNVFYKTSIFMW